MAGRSEHVAGGDALAVDQALAFDGADDEAGEIVLTVGVEAGHLGGLAAQQRTAVVLAAARQALDDLLSDVGQERPVAR